jgi:hypothetical protein
MAWIYFCAGHVVANMLREEKEMISGLETTPGMTAEGGQKDREISGLPR